MEYRTLGGTGLKVSALSFGGSPLGGVFQQVDKNECLRTVHAAIDAGINFFDTSPFYGLTRSEQVLGEALRSVSRDRYLIGTKIGRYGQTEFDFSFERTTRSVHKSLLRLNVDYLDIVQCHDIEFGDIKQVIEEALPALRKLQEEGKIRYIGITGFPLRIYPAVLDQTSVDVVLSYCHYALNNTSLERLLPAFEGKQLGVINAAALSMGLLTNGGPPPWHPASEEIKRVCAETARFCRDNGKDLAELALQFALAEKRIHTTLVGMATELELQRNLQTIGKPLDKEFLREVQQRLAPIHNQTWVSPGQLMTDEEYPAQT
jgi:L-galactose dehydrogenase